MKYQPQVALKEMPMPVAPKIVSGFECIYGKHAAEVLHRGTAYCRACYDERNPFRTLIDS